MNIFEFNFFLILGPVYYLNMTKINLFIAFKKSRKTKFGHAESTILLYYNKKKLYICIYKIMHDLFCNAVRGERFILAAKCVIWRFSA